MSNPMAEPGTHSAPVNPGSIDRHGAGLPEGWGHFSFFLALLVVWFFFLAFQVVYQRPEAPPTQGAAATLPSRAQLSTADAVWLVEFQKDSNPRVLEVVAGEPFPATPVNQLEIGFLNQAVTRAKNEADQLDPSNLWLVPVTFEKANPATASLPQEGNAGTWKVSPLPPDPSRPKGEAGRVYLATGFNADLMKSWWKKAGK